MKLSSSRIFDTQKVIKALAAAKVTGIDDFINNVAELSDQFIRILVSRVSLADNIDCAIKEIDVTHNTIVTLDEPNDKKRVQHIAVTRCFNFDHPVTAFAWQYNPAGKIDIKAQLLSPAPPPSSPTMARLTLVMYF